MNYKALFILLLCASSPAFASEAGFFSGFINWFSGIASDIHFFFTDSIPSMMERLTAWGVEYFVYAKLYLLYKSALFCFGVAKVIAADLHLSAYLSSAVSGLPENVKAVATLWGVPDCLNFMIHCWLTRFVMSFMGW